MLTGANYKTQQTDFVGCVVSVKYVAVFVCCSCFKDRKNDVHILRLSCKRCRSLLFIIEPIFGNNPNANEKKIFFVEGTNFWPTKK